MVEIVNEANHNNRLDIFLMKVSSLKYSREFIKNIIKNGNCNVNGKVITKAGFRTKFKDKVEFTIKPEADNEIKLIPNDINLKVIYEDDDLLVVNKDSGIVVHPGSGNANNTLMGGVIKKYSFLKNVGDNIRSGLIHRLDKDTSGIVLIGKTNLALWHYSRLFALRQVEKEYKCVVRKGFIEKYFKQQNYTKKCNRFSLDYSNQQLIMTGFIGRCKKNRKKMCLFDKSKDSSSKFSSTAFSNFNKKDDFCLLSALPKTGRTHQIRVHLASLGYPILGDRIYGGENYNRLMLHAYKIKIRMLNGRVREFTADIPEEFESFM